MYTGKTRKKLKGYWGYVVLILFAFPVFAFSGVIDELHKWDKPEVKVCWAVQGTKFHNCRGDFYTHPSDNHALSQSELKKYRDFIKETVTGEFKRDVVGISFVGWSECPVGVEVGRVADAMISLSVDNDSDGNFGGGSNVGRCDAKASDYRGVPVLGLTLYLGKWDKKLSFKDLIKLSSLHEFGHLAGLHHEDYIPEWPDYIEKLKAKTVGGYNSASVMSYEFLGLVRDHGLEFTVEQLHEYDRRLLGEWKNNPPSVTISEQGKITVGTKLSSGDIQSLRCLYRMDKCVRGNKYH